MKIWFIRHNNQSIGPYTIEELKNLAVTKDDYIWKEGLTDWIQVKSVQELKDQFTNQAPPPFSNQQSATTYTNQADNNYSYQQNNTTAYEKAGYKLGRNLRWIGIILVIGFVSYFIYAKNASASSNGIYDTSNSSEQLRVSLEETEKQNPGNYLKGTGRNRKNLIGQTVIEGTLTNTATLAVFKDVVLNADFISKTGTVIGSRQFTVYQIIRPGQIIQFKEKTIISKDIDDVQLSIVSGSPVN